MGSGEGWCNDLGDGALLGKGESPDYTLKRTPDYTLKRIWSTHIYCRVSFVKRISR